MLTRLRPVELGAERATSIFKNRHQWKAYTRKGGKKVIKDTISVSHQHLPAAQEEYFHAAQELAFGSVQGLEYLDPSIYTASAHVTHASILLDRVLSAAAAEMGRDEFDYWAKRSDEETQAFRDLYIRNIFAPYDKTPLGKAVNQRFRYPLINYEELGSILYNLTQDLDNFLFLPNGDDIDDHHALFEIISLQFGTLQQELTQQLLDLTDTRVTQLKDYTAMGKTLVEWGKRALQYYKGKPGEKQLITHHTHIAKEVDLSRFNYENSRSMAEKINQQVAYENGIPTTIINLYNLADQVKKNAWAKYRPLIDACFPENEDTYVEPNPSLLKKFGLTLTDFRQLVTTAKANYDRYQNGQHDLESLLENIPAYEK